MCLVSSIKYVRIFFRKTIISNPLISIRVRIRGLEMLVFRKILRTYLMDGPFYENLEGINIKQVGISGSFVLASPTYFHSGKA